MSQAYHQIATALRGSGDATLEQCSLHTTLAISRQRAGSEQPRNAIAKNDRSSTGHRTVHAREVALHLRGRCEGAHHVEDFLGNRMMLGESLRHREIPQIDVLGRYTLDADTVGRFTNGGTRVAGFARRACHYIREFSDAVVALSELLDQGRVRQWRCFHADGFLAARVEQLQRIEFLFVHWAIES